METWQRLQARLTHLAYLGEQLAGVVATSPATSAWLYREIAHEASEVARVAGGYIAECERAQRARDGRGGGAL